MTTQQFQKNTVNLIRSIMRAGGKTQVWNNKYDDCRTVKCYRDKDACRDLQLKDIIVKTLNDLNIKHKIKFTLPSGGPFNPGTGGFIVRIGA
jgi:hypothetical protein